MKPKKEDASRSGCILFLSAIRQPHRDLEFSLTENKVIQSRGVCNTNTGLYNRIVKLVNANAHRFIKARASA